MLSRLGRSGLALAAAGALGAVAPAAAETQPPVVPAATCPAADRPASQTEIQRLELAWLGHPATFPYTLAAVPVGSCLELRGFVPTEAVHEQAVALARQMTDAPVHDRLSVHPGLAARVPAGSLADVQNEAIQALRDAFGDRIDHVEVAARAGGQVTLRGTVESLEHKLLASRQMRQVRGCTCVANQLEVGPVPTAAAILPPPAIRAVSYQPEAPPTPAPAPAPVAPAPVAKPTPPVVQTAAPAPAKTTAAPAKTTAIPGKPTGKFIGHSPYASVYAPGPGVGTGSPYGVTSSTAPKPSQFAASKPGSKVVPASAASASTAPKVVPAVGSVVEPAHPVITGKVSQDGYESKGVLLLLDNDVAPPLVRADQPLVPSALETVIRNLCGADVKEVKVKPMPDKSLTVSVSLSRAEAEKTVVPLLLQLPEMSQFDVRLEVTVP